MGKINTAKVVTGGLLAGLIVNIVEFLVNGIWLAQDWQAVMQALGKSGDSTSQMVVYVVWGFVIGIFAVWVYAGFRPRFGPGPGTAIIAAFAAWFPGYLLAMIPPALMGIFPIRLMIIGVVVGFVELTVGTLLGAYLYKE